MREACLSFVLCALFGGSLCLGQSAQGALAGTCKADPALPAFEVASIKAVAPRDRGYTSIGQYGSPQFVLRAVSLNFLLSFAFDVQPANFVNAPRGLHDAVFDVQVEAADALPLSYETVRPRMQQLLQQRFCLQAHEGTRPQQGYALVVAKGGPKVQPLEGRNERGSAYITQRGVNASGATLDAFAAMLASPAGRPVANRTGLAGVYNLKVQFASTADAESSMPSVFTAVREQMGLELVPAQVMMRTLVVDRLHLVPTAD